MKSKIIGVDQRRDISPLVLRMKKNESGFMGLVMRRQVSVLLMASIFSVTQKTRSPARGEEV